MIKYNRVQYNKVTQTTVNKTSEKKEERLRKLDKALELIREVKSDDEVLHDYYVFGKLSLLVDACELVKILLREM